MFRLILVTEVFEHLNSSRSIQMFYDRVFFGNTMNLEDMSWNTEETRPIEILLLSYL